MPQFHVELFLHLLFDLVSPCWFCLDDSEELDFELVLDYVLYNFFSVGFRRGFCLFWGVSDVAFLVGGI